MPVCSANDVVNYTNITTGSSGITAAGLIPIVQDRINLITNNYFTTDMYLHGTMTFTSASGAISATASFEDEGFLATDEIYIYNSYRNDGYKALSAVSSSTLTVASTASVTAEPSGRSILISVVKWPDSLGYIAAQMVKYDYDDRKNMVPGIKSYSLGPYSYSRGGTSMSDTPFGYPHEIIDALASYTIVRLM